VSINSNIWELAEAYLGGSLSSEEVIKLEARLAADAEYANEFGEVADLIRSVEDAGKQRRFRTMLRDVHQQQTSRGSQRCYTYIYHYHLEP
jgi:hypothetical protein